MKRCLPLRINILHKHRVLLKHFETLKDVILFQRIEKFFTFGKLVWLLFVTCLLFFGFWRFILMLIGRFVDTVAPRGTTFSNRMIFGVEVQSLGKLRQTRR